MATNIRAAKRVVDKIKIAGEGRHYTIPASRRWVQGSSYDKNQDDDLQGSAVPDDMIQASSAKYWEPNPDTGVFGPAEKSAMGGKNRSFSASGIGGPAQDLAPWFRPLEDVQKPPQP